VQSIPVERVWTGQEVNKVVAMGLHEGTKEPDVVLNPKTYRPIVPGKEGAGSITASASSNHVGKMNQVDAMCPEDRGGKRGGFEAVFSREGTWNLVVVRGGWIRCLSVQGSCRGGGTWNVQDDSCER